MSEQQEKKYDYDLVIIGGGSGGISCAREASKFGAKVAVLDFVKPSPQGTKYGLGGTCVNVGCIPKKLFHTSAIYGKKIKLAKWYGWKDKNEETLEKVMNNDWIDVRNNIFKHVKGLNFKYKGALSNAEVKYFNEYGTLLDKHTIEKTKKNGKKSTITAKNIVISVGGRPSYPNIPGAKEYCISSDDIFQLKKHPGKTLCIGASYVSLECAGFLSGLGVDTTVMVRSIVLRGFDRDCAELIKFHLEFGITRFKEGASEKDIEEKKKKLRQTRILQPCSPTKIEKLDSGKLKVTYIKEKKEYVEEFDTVFFATGRTPETKALNLEKIGVKLDKNGKIIVNDCEQSSVDNIYGIGDVISGGLELTPVAIKAGKLLADRLFNPKTSGTKMDYINVPTTVFTPLEYGCVGYSEEAAIKKFGREKLIIYKKNCNILENEIPDNWLEIRDQSFFKLICLKEEKEKVIGFHFCGPHAGEVTQGIAIAIRLGATKEDFDNTVGIHPTSAENMTRLEYGIEEDTGC